MLHRAGIYVSITMSTVASAHIAKALLVVVVVGSSRHVKFHFFHAKIKMAEGDCVLGGAMSG